MEGLLGHMGAKPLPNLPASASIWHLRMKNKEREREREGAMAPTLRLELPLEQQCWLPAEVTVPCKKEGSEATWPSSRPALHSS